MDYENLRNEKQKIVSYCRRSFSRLYEEISNTDPRLCEYIHDVLDEFDRLHCIWELLSVRSYLDKMDAYTWNADAVRKFFNFYESIKFSGLIGRRTYRLTPVQCFQFANIFGFYRNDGRRLVRTAILFVPRKFGKTTGIASLAVHDLLFGDANAQTYIASNSSKQSAICFNETKAIIDQLNTDGKRFSMTSENIRWKKNRLGKESYIECLTAGAKTKDGLNCSLAIYDEYAAARYVRDHSDGAELLNVLTSSMGTRRDPLTVIITTANRVNNGPFEQMLNGAKEKLVEGGADWMFASIFQPDPWEMDDEHFADPEIWRKCNPHIGITVQPDFYDLEWEQAEMDPEKRKEFLCKYLNVFQSDKVRDWLTSHDVAALQTDDTVGTIGSAGGRWVCCTGMDFSRGDDLCGIAYLCYSVQQRRFFVDCDAWITMSSLERHANSTLYKQWVDSGYLHVCDGDVIPEQIVTDRVAELNGSVSFARFGYDPYDAKQFVNYLESWLRGKRVDPGKMVRPVRQTWGQFNSSVQTLERLVKSKAITFSNNPIIPWCFGNAVLEEDKFENVKPVKRTANGKIDIVICILEAVILFDELNG